MNVFTNTTPEREKEDVTTGFTTFPRRGKRWGQPGKRKHTSPRVRPNPMGCVMFAFVGLLPARSPLRGEPL